MGPRGLIEARRWSQLDTAIGEARIDLPELIHRLIPGEEVVITEYDRPVARLARTDPRTHWRYDAGGADEPFHRMAPDFAGLIEEFTKYME